MKANPEKFTDFNYITNSRAYGSVEKMNKYMNVPLTNDLCDCKPLYQDVCTFFSTLNSRLPNTFPEELVEFAQQGVTDSVPGNIHEEETIVDNNNPVDNEEDGVMVDSIPNFSDNSDVKYITNDDMAPYNLMSGKLINYFDVFKITTNIARTQLSVVITKDENIVSMEEREINRLRQELDKYMKNVNIQKYFTNLNIDELNLKQLQYYTEKCKSQFESLKVLDVAEKGLEIFDFGYNTFCPNGIRITKNKVIKLNDTTNALKEVLFDRNSTAPISFKNVIDKYNIHISDEVNTIFNIAGKFLKRIKIEDYEGSDEETEEKEEQKSVEVSDEETSE
jgi:hypothetical protein